jgi:hypothetical protein
VLALACLGTGTLYAQVVEARIEGVVTDATAAAIPGADVTVRNEDTGVIAFHGVSNASGFYRANEVKPGRYEVTVVAPGFQQQVHKDVQATQDQGLTLDFQLLPGSVNDVVTVEGSAQQSLHQSDATVSTLITPAAVQDLPLNNRDITQTFLLVPGVSQGSNTNSQNNAQLSVNGSRTLGTNPLLDGTSVITASTGQIDTLPSPDALGEVKIITSNSSAEYGRSSGATVLFGTRSGTNTLHGGLYGLLRNEAFDANTWSNKNTLPITPRSRDRFIQFGGTIGGRLLIPHLYDGRDRTFFFFNYDQTIVPTSQSSLQTVPSAALRSGDLSSFASTQPILDPQTNRQIQCNGRLNVICANRIDPAAAKYLALLPGPSANTVRGVTNFGTDTNNYYQVAPLRQTRPRYSGRVDQTFGTRLDAFGSVTKFINNLPNAVLFNPILNTGSSGTFSDGWNASAAGVLTVTPTLIAQAHMGLYRSSSNSAPTSQGIDVANTLGIASSPAAITPTVSIAGYAQMGPSPNTVVVQLNQTVSYDGSVTKLLGAHTLKAGGQMRHNQFNRSSPTQFSNGQYVFDGSITQPNHSAGNTVNSLADFLLGAVKTATYELPQPTQRRRNGNLAFFLQDDWRVRSNLTVNLGLRQEYESPVTVVGNIYSRFDPNTGSLLVAGQNADRTLNTSTPDINLGPHVGFAYTPQTGTVIRGGFSIVYGQIFSNLGSQVNAPGFDIITNYSDPGPGKAQAFTLAQGMPLNARYNLANPAAALGPGSPSAPLASGGPEFFSTNPLSSVQQSNLGMEQELGRGVTLELNYIHSHGVHLPLLIGLNQPQDVNPDGSLNRTLADQIASVNTTAATQNTRPFPNLGTISGQGNYGQSKYDALQATLRRQFNRSVAFTGSYTWSHAVDDSSGIYSFSQPSGVNGQMPYLPALRRRYDVGTGEFDQRNAVNLGFQLTSGGGVWTRNFRLAGIVVLHSGLPQTITQTSLFPGVSSQRPNGNARLARAAAGLRNGAAVQYYKPPTDPTFPFMPTGPYYISSGVSRVKLVEADLGNSGRGSQNQPGEETVNLSASRTFRLTERVSVQLRVDALNAFNHTNLSGANTSLGLSTTSAAAGALPQAIFTSGSFGTITSAYAPRNLQLLSRLFF